MNRSISGSIYGVTLYVRIAAVLAAIAVLALAVYGLQPRPYLTYGQVVSLTSVGGTYNVTGPMHGKEMRYYLQMLYHYAPETYNSTAFWVVQYSGSVNWGFMELVFQTQEAKPAYLDSRNFTTNATGASADGTRYGKFDGFTYYYNFNGGGSLTGYKDDYFVDISGYNATNATLNELVAYVAQET